MEMLNQVPFAIPIVKQKKSWRKQFLKPDWRKIVLTVIFLVWMFFGSLSVFTEGNINPIIVTLLFVGLILLSPTATFSSILIPINPIIAFIVQIILAPICAYLLSCLIIWIYDKYKKKK